MCRIYVGSEVVVMSNDANYICQMYRIFNRIYKRTYQSWKKPHIVDGNGCELSYVMVYALSLS